MFLGVLDKTIIIGYLLHYDVVRFFFQSFLLQYTIILVIAPSKHHETTQILTLGSSTTRG